MLTPAELDAFRSDLEAKQRMPTRERFRWFTPTDGPLAGLRLRFPDPPTYSCGWCHATRGGTFVAEYRSDAVGGWRFHGWSQPGGKESGRE